MPSATVFETMTRLGFAARALTYGAIGYLTLRLGRTEDNQGALSFIHGAGGGLLLGAMAIGFLGYGLWRLGEAAVDGEGHGRDAKGIVKRLGGAISGLIHLGLAWGALGLAQGRGVRSGDMAQQGASTMLAFPGGVGAIFAVAAILLVVGLYQLVKAVRLGFLKHLDHRVSGQAWVRWVGRAGYLARGTVFVATALFMFRAGRQAEASAAGGMEQALDSFPHDLRLLVAAGLLLFGVFSMVEAIYRRIEDPEVLDRLKRRLA